MTALQRRVLALDVGKTGCRGARFDGSERVAGAQTAGSVGIAGEGGVAAAAEAVLRTLRQLGGQPADAVVVGLAGLGRARDKAPGLAAAIGPAVPGAQIVLTSDMTTSHAGGLAGEPGVVLAAGTGVVALGVDHHGRSAVCDGWGYLLGDDGSGYAIGRAGLSAALREHDGRGGSALLQRLAAERYGDLDRLPALVHGSANPARVVAVFAADVRRAADEGDEHAVAIWQQAARDLARCAYGAARLFEDEDVIVTTAGGLFDAGPLLTDPFEEELRRLLPRVRPVPPRGDALDGARLLAAGGLPHEGLVMRFPGQGSATAASTSPVDVDTRLHRLETEATRPDLADLDTLTARDIVGVIAREDSSVPLVVAQAADTLAEAVDLVVDRLARGGRLVYVGAGTSGRLAVLDVAELLPTYGVGPDTVVAVMAGGLDAVLESVEGAEDDEAAAERDLAATGVGADDVVVAVTASGRTPYVLAAVDSARKAGAATVGICNNRDTDLSARVDLVIELPTGPEVVAGSTRMKSGTAQKLALNTLSTAAMVRLGKVYGNRMVDMRATNDKLRRRAHRIVAEVTGASAPRVAAALEEADGEVKTAIVVLLSEADTTTARHRLTRTGGSVRAALGEGDVT